MPTFPSPSESFLDIAVTRLVDAGLVALFLDAQFSWFSPEWCLEKFRSPYPPASVAFGPSSWERYEAAIRNGRSYEVRT